MAPRGPAAGRVVVVGLGPAGPEHASAATLAAIERVAHRFVRTTRHPAASVVPDATALDSVYETAPTLEAVYERAAEVLAEAAARHGEVLYAVPGSPNVAERTVELLRSDPRVDVEVLPALSFLDLAWARLGVDPVAKGVRVVDGQRFAEEAAGERGPLLVAQCDSRWVLSAIKLAVDDPPTAPVTVLQRLGLPDESVRTVAWADLDREVEPDHLTSLYVEELAAPVAAELVRFAELVRTLRERCPWDREQTHRSLTRFLVEEAYEVVEAIEGLDGPSGPDHLEEELGDVLFQVFFHATLAAEEGWFGLADVARTVHDKLVHRHPHVFGHTFDGMVEADSAGAVVANWEQIKKAEKGRTSVMEGIPAALPSLLHATKVQKKAASAGFDWSSPEGATDTAFEHAAGKVAEELAEVRAAGEDPERREEELGDLLFAAVAVARHLGVDPEAALRGASAKFRDRFVVVEARAAERGAALSSLRPDELVSLWEEAKAH